MLKKLTLTALLALSTMAATAAPAAAGENPGCMLMAGCFWTDLEAPPGDPGYWTCPDPQTYMLCREE